MPFKLVPMRRFCSILLVLAPAMYFSGQLRAAASGGQGLGGQGLTGIQAQALVERALGAELRTVQDPNHPMRYLLRKTTPRLTTTKEIVETRDGAVARLVAIFDRPLNTDEEAHEQDRLNLLFSDPSRQQHRKQSEEGDLGLVLKLLRMLPKAYLYQYAGQGAGQVESPAGSPAGIVEKFTFRPNPAFNPPDLESQALTAMTGELWIDAAQERVVRLEGHLQQDTDYGWGILGKLDKGGWIVIEQSDVGGRQWRIMRFKMRMDLRVLFKARSIDTTEEMTRYEPVSAGMDYRQAIQMLRGAAWRERGSGR